MYIEDFVMRHTFTDQDMELLSVPCTTTSVQAAPPRLTLL